MQCWSCVANAIVLVNSSGAGVHAIRLYMLTLCPKFTCCKPGFSETSVWIVALFFYIKTKKEERGQRHIRSKPPPQRKQPMSREDAGTYASDSFNAPHKAAMCACLNSIEWPLLVIATIYIFCQISFNQHF